MIIGVKSAAATVIGIGVGLYALVNRELSPLFWVLIVALALDLLLNIKNEAAVREKLVKAAAATLLPMGVKFLGVASAAGSSHTLIIATVAAITLLILQGIVPELMTAIGVGATRLGGYLGERYAPEVALLEQTLKQDVAAKAAAYEKTAELDQQKG